MNEYRVARVEEADEEWRIVIAHDHECAAAHFLEMLHREDYLPEIECFVRERGSKEVLRFRAYADQTTSFLADRIRDAGDAAA
jgi:hypothetical protein